MFNVVVPLGVAALALAVRALPESSDPQDRSFDASAQLLGAIVLGGIALAAIEGRTAPPIAIAAVGASSVALPLFCRIEAQHGAAALVPLDFFSIRPFRGAVIATAGMTFGMYGVLFLQPLTWQSSGRLSAMGAGLALMPMALVFAALSPFSGALGNRIGARAMTGGGVAVIGSGLFVLAAAAGAPSLAATEFGLALTGLGMGLATGPLFGVAVGSVPEARSGTASAIINVARMVGATLGVACLGTLFAALGAGSAGLRAAMLLGGLVQVACAAAAWLGTPPDRTRPG